MGGSNFYVHQVLTKFFQGKIRSHARDWIVVNIISWALRQTLPDIFVDQPEVTTPKRELGIVQPIGKLL